jgi:hypothetical protein
MRITPHKFIVTAVQDMQQMIKNRGKEKLPLLVVQARTALDYEQESPSMPIRSDSGAPEKPHERRGPEQQKSAAKTRSKPVSSRVP